MSDACVRLKNIDLCDDCFFGWQSLIDEAMRLIESQQKQLANAQCGSCVLTQEERRAIEQAADLIDDKTCGDSADLRKLLERTK